VICAPHAHAFAHLLTQSPLAPSLRASHFALPVCRRGWGFGWDFRAQAAAWLADKVHRTALALEAAAAKNLDALKATGTAGFAHGEPTSVSKNYPSL